MERGGTIAGMRSRYLPLWGCCGVAITIAWLVMNAGAAEPADIIRVIRPRVLKVEQIPCLRVPFGQPDDYKPSLVQLPNGQLLVVLFRGKRLENGKINETPVLYRSSDEGKTWSAGEVLQLKGREPYLSISNQGTLFITAHLLAQDIKNTDGYVYSLIHRSDDHGRTWSTIRFEPESFRDRTISLGSRNILQLADGSLLVGISEHAPRCQSMIWRSFDDGKTWSKKYRAKFEGVPKNYPYTLLGEAHFWQAKSKKLYAILRVGSGNSWPLKGRKDPGTSDQSERMVVYSSTDLGKTWQFRGDLGDYGQMYMSILQMGTGRLLLTYTQRDIAEQLGVRGALGVESRDGFTFDMNRDQIMIEMKTPRGTKSGGGFGPTIRLKDGTLLTVYTYRDASNIKHAEVVRWTLP